MYPWQAAALECGRCGSNLVYCAPTSGGKSLVAEILLIRRLFASKRPGRAHHGYHVRLTASTVRHATEMLLSCGCLAKLS